MKPFGYVRAGSLAEAVQALIHRPADPAPLPVPDSGPAPDPENAIAARLYTDCADSRWPTRVSTYRANVAADRVRYPLFGAAAADLQPCAFWRDPAEKADQGGHGAFVFTPNRCLNATAESFLVTRGGRVRIR